MARDMKLALAKFLNAEAVKEPIRAPVEAVKLEQVGGETKDVLYLSGVNKGLPLNVVNTTTLINGLGRYDDEWIGKIVEIYATECSFKGKQVPCVRVRVPKD